MTVMSVLVLTSFLRDRCPGLYVGFGPAAIGHLPGNGAYFIVYSWLKDRLQRLDDLNNDRRGIPHAEGQQGAPHPPLRICFSSQSCTSLLFALCKPNLYGAHCCSSCLGIIYISSVGRYCSLLFLLPSGVGRTAAGNSRARNKDI